MTYHITTGWLVLLVLVVLWDLLWRGIALWRSSRQRQKGWFIALLILNTASVLPLIYLATTDLHPRAKELQL
ncbi:MAG TPA: DUF5652 family protein [Candidatus Saccharimonadales bacterium]|nr:DUF5652 family protein [Candidatus Saccharimonadales bacterium]